MSRHLRPYIKRNFGRIITETPYDATWVTVIKNIIPASHRKFEGGNVWSFDPRYYACVRTIVEHFFGTVIDSVGGVAEPQTNGWKEAWDVCKEELRKGGYRSEQKQQQSGFHNGRTQNQAKTSSAFATLFVTENAPKEVVTAAYRTLVKLHHPDNGGDHEVMSRINAAHDSLKKIGKA